MRVRGVLAGYLTLIVAYVLVSDTGAASASGLLGTVSKLITRLFDPTVPGIPDHSSAAASDQSATVQPTAAAAASPPAAVVIPTTVRMA